MCLSVFCVHTSEHDNTAVRGVSLFVLDRCDFLCSVYKQANTIIRLYGALILSQGWLVWKTRDVPGLIFFFNYSVLGMAGWKTRDVPGVFSILFSFVVVILVIF